MHRFFKKTPRKLHLARTHWNKKRGNIQKAKFPFSSKEDARNFIRVHHLRGYSEYLCPECGKYHIGHK